jgi:phosphoribosyl-ATP pyrophosphohydrolase
MSPTSLGQAYSLDNLAALIAARAEGPSDASYTRQLLDDGVSRCARKLGEEAVELVVAAMGGHKPEIVGEAADVLYHLLVLLQATDVPFEQVTGELARRTKQSGLQEKASRGR